MGQSGRPDLYDSRRGCLHHHLSKRLERGHLAFRFLPAIGCRQTTIRQITSLPGRSCLRIRFGRKRRNARSISPHRIRNGTRRADKSVSIRRCRLGNQLFLQRHLFLQRLEHIRIGKSGTVLPVFANVKGYLPVSSKAALNLSWDLGAAIGVGGYFNEGTEFYTSIGPGVTFGRQSGGVRGDFSIRFQHMGEGLNAILFRIGIGF